MDRRRVRGLPPAVVRAGWGIADQAVSSLTNFALGIVVARTFSAEELGAYSLVFATYLVALNVARPLTVEPLLIRHADTDMASWRAATEQMSGVVLLVGLIGGTACALLGLRLGGALGASYVALGVALPGLLVQDGWRFAFIAAGRARDALANDVAWAVALAPVFAVLVGSSRPAISDLVLTWGVSGTLAALIGVAQARLWPRPRRARSWLAEHGDLMRPLTARSVASMVAGQFSSYGIAIVAGLSATGALRAAQLLMGPVVFLMQALQIVAVPEGRRIFARSPAVLGRACVVYAVVVSAIVIGWGLLIAIVPADVGTAVLRHNWEPAHAVILAAAFAAAAGWLGSAGSVGLRVLAQGRRLLLSGLVNSGTSLGGAVGGAAVAGALGGALGNGVGSLCGAAVTWWHLRAALAVALAPDVSAREDGAGGAHLP